MWQPFTEEHQQFRKTVRAFAEKELAPHVDAWEEAGLFPREVFTRLWARDHVEPPSRAVLEAFDELLASVHGDRDDPAAPARDPAR